MCATIITDTTLLKKVSDQRPPNEIRHDIYPFVLGKLKLSLKHGEPTPAPNAESSIETSLRLLVHTVKNVLQALVVCKHGRVSSSSSNELSVVECSKLSPSPSASL
ncbi:hypothetical protein Tco_1508662 [Tanacetum coccineum]